MNMEDEGPIVGLVLCLANQLQSYPNSKVFEAYGDYGGGEMPKMQPTP